MRMRPSRAWGRRGHWDALRPIVTAHRRLWFGLIIIACTVAPAGGVQATDSDAVWLPQSRRVHVDPESLGYPREPAPPPAVPTVRVVPQADPPQRPTDRRTERNWRLRPVYERKPYDRSTIPGEDALNRPTALQFRL